MNTKSFSLGIVLFAVIGAAFGQEMAAQEFVVPASQVNNSQLNNSPVSASQTCQENCTSEAAKNQNDAAQNSGNNSGSAPQIDRSGMDKASIHLQILQQTTPRFTESSGVKKPTMDDKKSSTKSQDNS
ncbi:MAG: hypothetical protein K2P84_06915 [Undibacterium sp.]|nr:hypothetical protein [Undibacterium sp.]